VNLKKKIKKLVIYSVLHGDEKNTAVPTKAKHVNGSRLLKISERLPAI
jgi:hypothetical protein